MKFLLSLALALAAYTAPAFAYTSASSYDPYSTSTADQEVKTLKKSALAGYSDAIAAGQGVYYSESELALLSTGSLYYSGAGNDQISADLIAGIAKRAVATGSNAGFPVVVRGYATAAYDATAPIVLDGALCIGNAATVKGKLIACASGVRSPIHSLQAVSSGSGTALQVSVHSK